MNALIIRFLMVITLAIVASCYETTPNIPADTIYLNGDVITLNDAKPQAEAIAIKNGLIYAVGSNSELATYKGSQTKIIDLAGKTLVPGFVDAHSHFSGVGMQAITANLLPLPDGQVNSIADLQKVMRSYIRSSPIVKKYGVAIGFNYDDSQLVEKRHPTRHDLDQISTTIPIVVMHQSAHMGAYNSMALELTGINATTENPFGGIIERENDGETPNGVLKESAHFTPFFKLLPKFTEEDIVKLFKAGEQSYTSNGFTTVQDGKTDPTSLAALPKVASKVGFKIDLISYPDLAAIGDSPVLHGPLMSTEYSHGFRIGGVKLSLDGSPQGKTAWFSEPYYRAPQGQSPDYAGHPALTDQEASQWLTLAYQNNWQVLVHANGDAAIDQLIRLVEQAQPLIENRDHRTVAIHAQYTRKDQVKKFKQLGIFPALYPMHTFYWGDWHRASVAGPERAENISPTGWFLKESMPFTIHSDAPVTLPNSMRMIDSAVNRTTRTNRTLGKQHKITALDALKALTIWGAYQHFEEEFKGSLEVGKQADFVILNKSPLTVSPRKIKDIKILETINDGNTVYLNQHQFERPTAYL